MPTCDETAYPAPNREARRNALLNRALLLQDSIPAVHVHLRRNRPPRRRVVAAEERFYVRGTLVLMLLGQNTPTEIEEEQGFQMRIAEK